MCLGCGAGGLCCCNAFPWAGLPQKCSPCEVRPGRWWDVGSSGHPWLQFPWESQTFALLHFYSLKYPRMIDFILFFFQLYWCNWHGAVSLVNIPSSQIETTWKTQKKIYIVFPWNENSSGFLSWPLSHVTHIAVLVVFITLHINISRIYTWELVPFDCYHPGSHPPPLPLVTTDLIFFFYAFVCFWSVIDLPHYISPGCTTRQSDISLHFRMSPMVSLAVVSSHKDTMSLLTITPHCTVHTHDSFVF